MRRPSLRLAVFTIVLLSITSSVRAQTGGPLAGRLELAVGVDRVGSISFGPREATLTGSGGNRFQLFSTDTSLEGASGLTATIGVSLSRMFQVEGTFSYAKPPIRTSLSNDVEQAAPVVATDTVQEFVLGASLVAHLRRWTFAKRAVPFVSAGGGYLRDLHAGQTFAENGQAYHVGGGVKYQFKTRTGKLKGLGLRAEVSAVARRKGAAFDTHARVAPAIGAALFARF